MHTLTRSKIRLFLCLLFLMLLLSACGSEVSITKDGDCVDTADGGALCVKLTDSSGNTIRDIERNSSATIVASIRDADNNGISGAVVDFSTTEGELTLGAGLTDNGVANATINTGAERKVGKITVTFTDESGDSSAALSVSYGFTIGATQEVAPPAPDAPTGEGTCKATESGGLLCLKITNDDGDLVLDIDTEATANLIATLKSATNTEIQGTTLNFTSTSSTLGQSLGVTQSNGEVSIILTAGTDKLSSSATVSMDDNGTQLSVSYSFTIGQNETDPAVDPNVSTSISGAIEFVSSTPSTLALRNTGGTGLNEFSIVQFRVIGTDGLPMANRTVNFSLNTDIGGLDIDPLSATTDSSGLVSTTVQSGSIPTAIRITATSQMTDLDDNVQTIFTQSDQLIVSTGLPDQNSMSLSIETLNSETWGKDGVEVPVTVRLGDHFNNMVPDGTAVYFTTEGGTIQPSCFTTNGACSVNWVSSNPRPHDHRVTILATALGTESFHDTNSDGRYSLADGEPYADVNNNNVFDEAFVDSSLNGIFDEPFYDEVDSVWEVGEAFTDQLNGVYDHEFLHITGVTIPAELFSDIGNGTWDAGETLVNDANSNGVFDDGDTFIDIGNGTWDDGESFTDRLNGVYDLGDLISDSANNKYDIGEWFIDYNGNGKYDGAGNNPAGETVFTDSNQGNSLYDGSGENPAGEKHTDATANSLFDGPGFPDLPEPYLDANENGKYDIGEMYVDTNNNNVFEVVGDGQYNGILCLPNNNCSNRNTLHIRRQGVLVMSSSEAFWILKDRHTNIIYGSNHPKFPNSGPLDINGRSVDLQLFVADSAGQVMAMGTNISVSAPGVKVTGITSLTVPNATGTPYAQRSTIKNEDAYEFAHRLSFTITDLDPDDSDTSGITIRIVSPSDETTSDYINFDT